MFEIIVFYREIFFSISDLCFVDHFKSVRINDHCEDVFALVVSSLLNDQNVLSVKRILQIEALESFLFISLVLWREVAVEFRMLSLPRFSLDNSVFVNPPETELELLPHHWRLVFEILELLLEAEVDGV